MSKDSVTKFLKLVDSLRRAQRAELLDDDNDPIIEELYTDPLENDFILQTMLFNHTTLLIGRKGTGKSTIINRFQHEIRKSKDKLSLYLDVRTLYDQAFNTLPNTIENLNGLSKEEINRYQLFKHFFGKVISEIQNEVNKNVFTSRILKFIGISGLTESEFKKELEAIYNDVNIPKYQDITALQEIKQSATHKDEYKKEDSNSTEFKVNPKIDFNKEGVGLELGSIKVGGTKTDVKKKEDLTTKEFSTILIRYYNLIDFSNRLRELLKKVGINNVFICLDDASELDEEALDIFIRSLVAPLHNSADGFFKFKISFYPGREHLPDIDRSKVEHINLDYYELYQSYGVDKIEELAIDYTRRLLENRFRYFFDEDVKIEDFFDTKSISIYDYYKIIFQATSNVARNIGKLFWYTAKKTIFQSQKITKRSLQDAAKENYMLEIEPILYKNEFIQYKYYGEKFEREHLKRLLELIIQKSKENKRLIGESTSEIFKDFNTNTAPSNYLFFPPKLEQLIHTLELNFFITKYTQQKDKGQGSGKHYIPPKDVSVFTINYGLCQKENINFDEKSDRKFRIERVFDFTDLLVSWANTSQSIKCRNCDTNYSMNRLDSIKEFGMLCEVCHNKTCEVITVAIELPSSNIQPIKERDFLILNTLKIEDSLTTKQIAAELDSSVYSIAAITRTDRFLRTNEYISKDADDKFHITEKALQTFFN